MNADNVPWITDFGLSATQHVASTTKTANGRGTTESHARMFRAMRREDGRDCTDIVGSLGQRDACVRIEGHDATLRANAASWEDWYWELAMAEVFGRHRTEMRKQYTTLSWT